MLKSLIILAINWAVKIVIYKINYSVLIVYAGQLNALYLISTKDKIILKFLLIFISVITLILQCLLDFNQAATSTNRIL
jgi:hypothetical protein